MLKNLHEKLFGKNRRRGFTLLEVVTVVGVVVIMCAIAIPTLVSQERTTKYKQHNDYAQSIFMAAQANLSQMRSQGRLGQLETAGGNATNSIFPAGVPGSEDYRYVTSEDPDYEKVLPAGSIDSYVQGQAVIIEFNPVTGNVYSVFYSEDESAFNTYISPGLPRNDAEEGKKQMVGYYQGSAVDRHPHTVSEDAPIRVQNVLFEQKEVDRGGDGKAYLTFQIPTAGLEYDKFLPGLDVSLDVFGESGGSVVLKVLERGVTKPDYVKMENTGSTISFKILLDDGLAGAGASIKANPSFVNHLAGNYSTPASTLIENPSQNWAVKPGDNISVIVHANFTPGDGVKQVDIEPEGIGKINPMFGGLIKTDKEGKQGGYEKGSPDNYLVELLGYSSPEGDPLYTRHKTNLELIHPDIKTGILKIKTDGGIKTWDEINGSVTPTEGGV